jgi:hypothetical protein
MCMCFCVDVFTCPEIPEFLDSHLYSSSHCCIVYFQTSFGGETRVYILPSNWRVASSHRNIIDIVLSARRYLFVYVFSS